jgi:hypothetical protein
MLQQEFHVHFLSTSPLASVSEQYSALKVQIECVSIFLACNKLLTSNGNSDHHKKHQFQFMTVTLDMAQKSVSFWMQIALTTQCRVRLHATLVQRETATVRSATAVEPALRKNRTWDITSFSLFVFTTPYRNVTKLFAAGWYTTVLG